MITTDDIKGKLVAYLTNEITLHDFIQWFSAESWEVFTVRCPSVGLLNLVCRIKLRIYEFARGTWTEPQMRELLSVFVGNI
jgi:hypothetical protein